MIALWALLIFFGIIYLGISAGFGFIWVHAHPQNQGYPLPMQIAMMALAGPLWPFFVGGLLACLVHGR